MRALTALVGPNRTRAALRMRVVGRLGAGLSYRAVTGPGDRPCAVVRRSSFVCSFTLEPGREAALRLWLVADPLRAPAEGRQRVRAASSDGSVSAVVSWRHRVTPSTDQAPPTLAHQTSSSPGALLHLLALLMLALAAHAARRSHLHRA